MVRFNQVMSYKLNKFRAQAKMGEATSYAENKAVQEALPPPLTPINELSTVSSCNEINQSQTIPSLKRINNNDNLPTDIHSVLGTSPGKVVLINKNDTLHQVVVPNNVVLSQDAGPARLNIPEVGSITIKIDPKARESIHQSQPLYLKYETPPTDDVLSNQLPDSSQEDGLKGYSQKEIEEAEQRYNMIKRVMEEYEEEFKANTNLISKIVPRPFDLKTMKLEKSLSVLVDRNNIIEEMCRLYRK